MYSINLYVVSFSDIKHVQRMPPINNKIYIQDENVLDIILRRIYTKDDSSYRSLDVNSLSNLCSPAAFSYCVG